MELLGDDMLADILRRLPPCSLAASRCVRKHWCSVIDTRRLLRADLLPFRVGALLFNDFVCMSLWSLSCPSAAPQIDAVLQDFSHDPLIWDHCNGLLLFSEIVVNPATRQRLPLPPQIGPVAPGGIAEEDLYLRNCLVYDPMVSPQHFELFFIPFLHRSGVIEFIERQGRRSSEWPPSPYTVSVFSSRKWRWEHRSFVRQGGEPSDIADIGTNLYCRPSECRHAVYSRGAIYAHCQNHCVVRMDLSNKKYQMIKAPGEREIIDAAAHYYLDKSEKGVYSALLIRNDDGRWPRFRVWFLSEAHHGRQLMMEWELKTNISLQAMCQNFPYICDVDYDEIPAQEEPEWDFDSGGVIVEDQKHSWCDIAFLGFHPYKEIAIFFLHSQRAVYYHLNGAKVRELGISHPPDMTNAFLYTPCGEFLEEK